MAKTYIAFIECVFDDTPPSKWQQITGVDGYPDATDTRELHVSFSDDSRLSLVDLGGTRRYYSFKDQADAEIVGNVLVFDDKDAEQLAIDEDKQFPKKKRIDE